METVKDVVDSMLANNRVSEEEYSMMKEAGVLEMTKEEFSEKTASIGSLFRRFKRKAGLFNKRLNLGEASYDLAKNVIAPAAAIGTIGLIGKESLIDPIVQRHKMQKSFEMMKSKVPQLEGKSDKELKDYFGVIKTFSPKSASNPLVAGALVNKMIEFGGVDHKLVQDLSSIEAGLARPSTVQSAAEATAKSMVKVPGGKDDL